MEQALKQGRYVCDRSLATVVYLASRMEKPLLVEGEPGVGKTELARVVAEVLNRRLIRLQCYEGLDASSALYEWNYSKQILAIRLMEAEGSEWTLPGNIFSEEYLPPKASSRGNPGGKGREPHGPSNR